jgi:carbon-monoxide dehydrogenase medium subunit
VIAIRDYVRVDSLEELFSLFDTAELPVQVIAGGTDLLTKLDPHSPSQVVVADIANLGELIGVRENGGGFSVGAATKLARIEESRQLTGASNLLRLAAGKVGSRQIRNLGTVGGNLCNASPCADTAPPLLTLGAQVELASALGRRTVALTEFFRGPGETILRDGEVLAAVHVPGSEDAVGYAFLRHSPRGAMDLSAASVAALVSAGREGLDCRIAMGSVAPRPMRADEAERFLRGISCLDRDAIHRAADLAAMECSPITDVRGSAEYRRELVRTLTRRALHVALVMLEDCQSD